MDPTPKPKTAAKIASIERRRLRREALKPLNNPASPYTTGPAPRKRFIVTSSD